MFLLCFCLLDLCTTLILVVKSRSCCILKEEIVDNIETWFGSWSVSFIAYICEEGVVVDSPIEGLNDYLLYCLLVLWIPSHQLVTVIALNTIIND